MLHQGWCMLVLQCNDSREVVHVPTHFFNILLYHPFFPRLLVALGSMGLIGLGAPGCDWTSCEDEAFLRTAAITGGHDEVIQVCFEGIELRQDLHDFEVWTSKLWGRLLKLGWNTMYIYIEI